MLPLFGSKLLQGCAPDLISSASCFLFCRPQRQGKEGRRRWGTSLTFTCSQQQGVVLAVFGPVGAALAATHVQHALWKQLLHCRRPCGFCDAPCYNMSASKSCCLQMYVALPAPRSTRSSLLPLTMSLASGGASPDRGRTSAPCRVREACHCPLWVVLCSHSQTSGAACSCSCHLPPASWT